MNASRNGLHIDTRTADEQYADGRSQGVADRAEVAGNPDALERRIKFCSTMAEKNKGTGLGHYFAGRLNGLEG